MDLDHDLCHLVGIVTVGTFLLCALMTSPIWVSALSTAFLVWAL